jgi:hypothetical protein
MVDKVLYAVAAEKPVRHGRKIVAWVPDGIIHCHATDEANARFVFFADPAYRHHRIVAVGPVVGYHVHDEHGEVLSA